MVPTSPAADEAPITAGIQVYKDQYCGICHELGAAGTKGVFGPIHDGMGSTAESRLSQQEYGGTATTAAEYIRESIVEPKAFVVPGYSITSHPMPAYDFLSEDDLLALVEMLLAQK